MHQTKHAKERSRERRISQDEIALILKFGKKKIMPDGAFEFSIHNKLKNELIIIKKMLNNVETKTIQSKGVLVRDDSIITVYHKFR